MLRAVRQAEEAGKPFDKNLAKLHEVLEASLARREAGKDRTEDCL